MKALKVRLVAPVVAALVALSVMLVPSVALAAPQLFCSYIVSGGSTSNIQLPADCGGGSFLSGGYHSIELDILGQCDSTVYTKEPLALNINGWYGNDYDWSWFSPAGTGSATGVGYTVIGNLPCQTTSNSLHSASAIHTEIPGAFSTVFKKSIISVSGIDLDTSNRTSSETWAGSWNRTSIGAVTRLDLSLVQGANFVAGTMIDVYIK